MKKMTRRELLGGLAGGMAMVSLPVITACAKAEDPAPNKPKGPTIMAPNNADFYKDGKFDDEVGKKAYYDLAKSFSCPTDGYDPLLWAIDFGLGEFTKVGMGGIFWMNSEVGKYLGHEILLLPGQMIPEHWHVEFEGIPPKREAWHVRYGSTFHGGAGEATPLPEGFPESQKAICVAKNVVPATPGQVVELGAAEEKHWMFAGPKGAIVTEYASYHSMDALRFSNDKVKL